MYMICPIDNRMRCLLPLSHTMPIVAEHLPMKCAWPVSTAFKGNPAKSSASSQNGNGGHFVLLRVVLSNSRAKTDMAAPLKSAAEGDGCQGPRTCQEKTTEEKREGRG